MLVRDIERQWSFVVLREGCPPDIRVFISRTRVKKVQSVATFSTISYNFIKDEEAKLLLFAQVFLEKHLKQIQYKFHYNLFQSLIFSIHRAEFGRIV